MIILFTNCVNNALACILNPTLCQDRKVVFQVWMKIPPLLSSNRRYKWYDIHKNELRSNKQIQLDRLCFIIYILCCVLFLFLFFYDKVSLCRPGCPGIHRNLPASASQVLPPLTGFLGKFYIRGPIHTSSFIINFTCNSTFLSWISKFPNL